MGRSDKRKRRDFLKKAAYAAPAILSLQAVSAVAKAGSVKDTEEQTKAKEKEKEAKKKEEQAREQEKQAKTEEKKAKKKEEEAKKKEKESITKIAGKKKS